MTMMSFVDVPCH